MDGKRHNKLCLQTAKGEMMKWINVKDYLPGNRLWEDDAIIVLLENGERHFLAGRKISGTWLARDGKNETKVTHWMLIDSPGGASNNRFNLPDAG